MPLSWQKCVTPVSEPSRTATPRPPLAALTTLTALVAALLTSHTATAAPAWRDTAFTLELGGEALAAAGYDPGFVTIRGYGDDTVAGGLLVELTHYLTPHLSLGTRAGFIHRTAPTTTGIATATDATTPDPTNDPTADPATASASALTSIPALFVVRYDLPFANDFTFRASLHTGIVVATDASVDHATTAQVALAYFVVPKVAFIFGAAGTFSTANTGPTFRLSPTLAVTLLW